MASVRSLLRQFYALGTPKREARERWQATRDPAAYKDYFALANQSRVLLDAIAAARSAAATYQASQIISGRATKAQVEARRDALYDMVEDMQPMTVRQVFYQATVRGIVEKTESGYAKVQTDLALMRREGDLDYDWIVDNTRWQRKPETYKSVKDAIESCAKFYRKDIWHKADCYVEIWLEKDALSGVVYPITQIYDVPLMIARGYASLSFLYSASEYISRLNVPAYIYHLGDFDPSGVNAAENIEATLRELAPGADIYFERVAVTPEQIKAWNLPTRPTKASDTRSKGFGDISVELDAIDPERLRALVRETIEQHLPADQFAALQKQEEAERASFLAFASNWPGDDEGRSRLPD